MKKPSTRRRDPVTARKRAGGRAGRTRRAPGRKPDNRPRSGLATAYTDHAMPRIDAGSTFGVNL